MKLKRLKFKADRDIRQLYYNSECTASSLSKIFWWKFIYRRITDLKHYINTCTEHFYSNSTLVKYYHILKSKFWHYVFNTHRSLKATPFLILFRLLQNSKSKLARQCVWKYAKICQKAPKQMPQSAKLPLRRRHFPHPSPQTHTHQQKHTKENLSRQQNFKDARNVNILSREFFFYFLSNFFNFSFFIRLRLRLWQRMPLSGRGPSIG